MLTRYYMVVERGNTRNIGVHTFSATVREARGHHAKVNRGKYAIGSVDLNVHDVHKLITNEDRTMRRAMMLRAERIYGHAR